MAGAHQYRQTRTGSFNGKQKRQATEAEAEKVRTMRDAGATWDDISRAMMVGRKIVMRWGEELGIPTEDLRQHQPPIYRDPMVRKWAGMDPLPPFHPIAAAVLAEARPLT